VAFLAPPSLMKPCATPMRAQQRLSRVKVRPRPAQRAMSLAPLGAHKVQRACPARVLRLLRLLQIAHPLVVLRNKQGPRLVDYSVVGVATAKRAQHLVDCSVRLRAGRQSLLVAHNAFICAALVIPQQAQRR
jgi:hypothetical protein